jgi:hypothetical protein
VKKLENKEKSLFGDAAVRFLDVVDAFLHGSSGSRKQ